MADITDLKQSAMAQSKGAGNQDKLAFQETKAEHQMWMDWKKSEPAKKLENYETSRSANPEKFDKGPLKADYDRLKAEERKVRETAAAAYRRSNLPVPADLESSTRSIIATGQVVDGYKFKGGNPNDKNNWEKVK